MIFDHCDLSNVDFSDAFIHRTEFRDCRLIGTDFTRARFQNVSFTGCIGEFAVFRFCQLQRGLLRAQLAGQRRLLPVHPERPVFLGM
ncbi:pentapeptide repeat-containing protein [Paenibacillus rhizoplanae]